MATSDSTMKYILEQVNGAGSVRARKMFGEYALYCNDTVAALVCDDQLFVKYTEQGKIFADGRYTEGFPYPGASAYMNVTDAIDDAEFITTLIRITTQGLPLPKKTGKKRKNAP